MRYSCCCCALWQSHAFLVKIIVSSRADSRLYYRTRMYCTSGDVTGSDEYPPSCLWTRALYRGDGWRGKWVKIGNSRSLASSLDFLLKSPNMMKDWIFWRVKRALVYSTLLRNHLHLAPEDVLICSATSAFNVVRSPSYIVDHRPSVFSLW